MAARDSSMPWSLRMRIVAPWSTARTASSHTRATAGRNPSGPAATSKSVERVAAFRSRRRSERIAANS